MKSVPDNHCVDAIYSAHAEHYSGLWIRAAREFYTAGNMLDAARAYENARNGFGKRHPDRNCLEAWRAFTEAQALQMAPAYGLQLLPDSFYENLQVLPVQVPVPVGADGVALLPDQMTYANVLESIRFYLLAQPHQNRDFSALVVMLALELADDENTFRDGHKAELFLGIAKDYAGRDLGLCAKVGYGYMRSGKYDTAVTELETVKRWLWNTGDFDPKVWVSLAHLYFVQERPKKARNAIQDYMAMCPAVGSEAVGLQLELALQAAQEVGVSEKFRELLHQMLAGNRPVPQASEILPAGMHAYAAGLLERARKAQRPLSIKLRLLLRGFGYERRTDKIIAEVHGYLAVCGLTVDFSVGEPHSLDSKVAIYLK